MKRFFACILAQMLLLASCFASYEEPLTLPSVISVPDQADYRTVPAGHGSVELFRDVIFVNVAAREEILYFVMDDLQINNIYVNVGDVVQTGDLLADLDISDILRNLEEAAQIEAWGTLNVRQLDERHGFNMMRTLLTGGAMDEAGYLAERRALLNQLELIQLDIDYYNREFDNRVLLAGMDGTVTSVLRHVEGDISSTDRPVVTISDQGQSIFMTNDPNAALLPVGSICDITINREVYAAQVADPESMDISRESENEVYLIIVDENAPLFPVRSSGSVRIVLEEAHDVIYIPVSGVHKVGGRTFAFILDNGLRIVQEIELGLEGNIRAEITGGLSLGDLVILS